MIKEASHEQFKKNNKPAHNEKSRDILFDHDENDLLAESPLFDKKESVGSTTTQPQENSRHISQEDTDDIDMALLGEIEEYLRGVMENNETIIEMSDSPIGSGGAKAVAAVLCLCDALKEVQM